LKDRLIAHRGDMTTYPENSLLAFQAAAELGFKNIELDIQLSKDHMPIVIHDENLYRTAGVGQLVRNLSSDEIANIHLSTSIKNVKQEELLILPTLRQAAKLLGKYKNITLFVEIKRQSVEHFPLDVVVDSIISNLSESSMNYVIISFLEDVIEYVKQKYTYPIGWVIKTFDDKSLKKANEIKPDYMFCNINKINMEINTLWEGKWDWVIYDIQDLEHVRKLLEQGISFVETGDIVKMSNAEL